MQRMKIKDVVATGSYFRQSWKASLKSSHSGWLIRRNHQCEDKGKAHPGRGTCWRRSLTWEQTWCVWEGKKDQGGWCGEWWEWHQLRLQGQKGATQLAGFVGQSKEFALCSKWKGKPVKCWQQGDLIWFMFKSYHSGCSVEEALKGKKVEVRPPNRTLVVQWLDVDILDKTGNVEKLNNGRGRWGENNGLTILSEEAREIKDNSDFWMRQFAEWWHLSLKWKRLERNILGSKVESKPWKVWHPTRYYTNEDVWMAVWYISLNFGERIRLELRFAK